MTQIVLTGHAATTIAAHPTITVNEMPPISAINKGIHVVGATGVASALTVVTVAPSAAEEIQWIGGNKFAVQLTTDLVVADSFILDCIVDGVFVRT